MGNSFDLVKITAYNLLKTNIEHCGLCEGLLEEK
jgi:hypothetical protein